MFDENQRSQEESTQDEEDVDSEESTGYLIRREMEEHYGGDRQTPEAIEHREMFEGSTTRPATCGGPIS
jgi:hypothetical protein